MTPAPAAPVAALRVGVVDDHPSIIAAVGGAIADADDLVLVGTARTLEAGIALAAGVDVLVCDVQLDGRAEGLELLDAVHRSPDPPAVLLLSGFEGPSVVRAAMERGAAGFLDKGVEVSVIVDAIRRIGAGGTVFTAARLQAARSAPRRPSDREIQVIDLVIAGATNAEAATRLGLSEKTIESHLRRLFDRYGVLSRTELAVLAMQEGWITPRDPA